MKSLRIVVPFCLVSASLLGADSLTAGDRQSALNYLEQTRAGVLDATQGLSPAQWNFKPAPERWSVAETLEHIASTEDMLMGLIQGQVMKAPPRPAGEDAAAIDAMVLKSIPDRSKKATAPEPLIPKNRFGSPEESREHFAASRAKTITFLQDTPGLRDHAIDSPLGKKLDGYQWLLFMSAHAERHTKQMLEVKADPGFPRS